MLIGVGQEIDENLFKSMCITIDREWFWHIELDGLPLARKERMHRFDRPCDDTPQVERFATQAERLGLQLTLHQQVIDQDPEPLDVAHGVVGQFPVGRVQVAASRLLHQPDGGQRGCQRGPQFVGC